MEEGSITAKDNNKIKNSQFYSIITNGEISWKSILLDLIKTEQLDPWDIDLNILADRYVAVIKEMEDADFYVSSNVLYACSYLLYIKAEKLFNRYLRELDEAVYGRQEVRKYENERIEIDENELPILVPRTPIERNKRVTLAELMSALNHAVETENRRIRRDIKVRQARKSALVVLPRADRMSLKDRVIRALAKIRGIFVREKTSSTTYSSIAPTKEEKLSTFLPILHLSNTQQIYLRQPKHFEEIFIHESIPQEEIDDINRELVLSDGEEDYEEESVGNN